MSNEPKWPSQYEVIGCKLTCGQIDGEGCYSGKAAGRALEMCRKAFLEWQRVENDDPASDLVGTVRLGPGSDDPYIRVVFHIAGRSWQWVHLRSTGVLDGYIHEDVRGWPIIGAVPGTPAAEAKS